MCCRAWGLSFVKQRTAIEFSRWFSAARSASPHVLINVGTLASGRGAAISSRIFLSSAEMASGNTSLDSLLSVFMPGRVRPALQTIARRERQGFRADSTLLLSGAGSPLRQP